ncbi:ATP-binding protein [Streptomyces albidochromogenes]|uniref:ATP-binding protein n=1 Tax=Streptomyces albidochromogenes TaxID=329524 RepID=UPI0024493F06|nr:ATP-binding protein [Streptomyces albidochromogenes]
MRGYEFLATAILDRLLHNCDVISINGPSYRLKNRLAAIDVNGTTRPDQASRSFHRSAQTCPSE